MTALGVPTGRCQACGGQLYATPGGRILCAGRCDDGIADRTPSTAPADVAKRRRFIDVTLGWVDEWRDMARADGGTLSTALLVACETITTMSAELAAMRERAERGRAEADDLRAHVDAYGVPHAD